MRDNYVYVFLDPRKSGQFPYDGLCFSNEPFYVGKGRNNRDSSFYYSGRSGLTKNKIKAIHKKLGEDPISIRVFDNMSNEEAYRKECELIKLIGRKDLEKGPLTNMTDGGNGIYNLGPETRQKISKTMKKMIKAGNLVIHKRVFTDEEKQIYSDRIKERHRLGTFGIKGKKHTEKTKRKISQSAKGRVNSKEHNENIKKNRWTDKAREIQSEKSKELHKLGVTGMKGKKHTKNTKRKMSEAHKGKILSKSHREKIKKNHWRRKNAHMYENPK